MWGEPGPGIGIGFDVGRLRELSLAWRQLEGSGNECSSEEANDKVRKSLWPK